MAPKEAEIKGKGVRHKPHPLTDNVHGVPEDLIAKVKKVDGAVDLFHISQVQFLAWTDLTFKYRMAPYMKNRKHKTFFKALDECLRLYNYYDFYIRSIYSDQELAPMFDLVKDTWDIQLNISAAQRTLRVCRKKHPHHQGPMQSHVAHTSIPCNP